MANLDIYNAVRTVPKEAIKPIQAGRLKGMSDINPMWRIKVMTEQFGVCGIGWKPKIIRQWLESGANGEIGAFVEIELCIKQNGEWSDGIPGVGGSKFVSKEANGLYTDDECFKKAYTDALSVACKALGVAADVYFEKDSTKYDERQNAAPQPAKPLKGDNIVKQEADSEKLRILSDIDTLIQTEQKKGKKPEGIINGFILGTSYETKKKELTDYTLDKYGINSLDELNYNQLRDVLYQTNIKAGKIK